MTKSIFDEAAPLRAKPLRMVPPPPIEWGDEEAPDETDDRPSGTFGRDGEREDCLISGLRLDEQVDATLATLGRNAPNLYVRGFELVRIVHGPKKIRGAQEIPSAPGIVPVPSATLRELIARHLRLQRRSKGPDGSWTVREVDPTKDHVAATMKRAEYPMLRPIRGIIEAPAMRPDGTVIQGESRYDAATGLFYAPAVDFPTIPELPNLADAKAAAAELLDVVKDFPFATPAHQSAWLAALLTIFARPAIDGPCPLMAIDATTPGTGKSLLADVTNVIALGRDASKMPQPETDAEMRKRITALVVSAEPVVLLDNVSEPLKYHSLDAVLTSTEWSDRELGVTGIVGGEARAVWLTTGNNIVFAGDLVRRVLHIRLETPLENPQDRDGFEHSDLRAWCKAERGRLVKAALVLLRAYFVAGQPTQKIRPWGSFEDWTRIVASCVVWVGLPNPLETQMALASNADDSKNTLAAMINLVVKFGGTHGTTVGAMLKKLYPPSCDEPDWYVEARETLETIAPLAGGKPSPRKLGAYLKAYRRRYLAGRCIDEKGTNQGAAVWNVIGGGP